MAGAMGGNVVRWAVVLGLAFAVALGLAVLVLQQPEGAAGRVGSSGLPADLAGGVTARRALPQAAEVARAWQPDAGLAVVLAHWRPRQGRWSANVAWTFQFYSPATHRLAVVAVEEGGARLLRETPIPYPLPTFAEADWQVDSPAALGVWWEAGGATFMTRHTETDLVAQLRIEEGGEEGRLVWAITGIAGDQVWAVVVDGTSGEQVQD